MSVLASFELKANQATETRLALERGQEEIDKMKSQLASQQKFMTRTESIGSRKNGASSHMGLDMMTDLEKFNKEIREKQMRIYKKK